MPRWKEKMLTKENEMQEWQTINFKSQWLLINYCDKKFWKISKFRKYRILFISNSAAGFEYKG